MKIYKSKDYNYIFNTKNGVFARWGKTLEDNPICAPTPEILDLEISTICSQGCSHCYKSNTTEGKNMSLETFKKLISKFKILPMQIAFGIGDIDKNKDLWNIMTYCRQIGIVPNITINGSRMTPYYYNMLAKLCGAVAVSHYNNDNVCFNCIEELTERGMTQINIHKLLAEDTLQSCNDLMLKSKTDRRLKNLNAIVFLYLKKKGIRNTFNYVNFNDYQKLVDYALDNNIRIGFDSCSANLFLKAIKDRKEYKQLEPMVEPCESFGLFSSYINVEGKYFPCSFCEGEKGWEEGIDVLKCKDFVADVWKSDRLNLWKEKSLACNRKCLVFNLEN
jgi:hypothetical protein